MSARGLTLMGLIRGPLVSYFVYVFKFKFCCQILQGLFEVRMNLVIILCSKVTQTEKNLPEKATKSYVFCILIQQIRKYFEVTQTKSTIRWLWDGNRNTPNFQNPDNANISLVGIECHQNRSTFLLWIHFGYILDRKFRTTVCYRTIIIQPSQPSKWSVFN